MTNKELTTFGPNNVKIYGRIHLVFLVLPHHTFVAKLPFTP